jgi:type IV pilus assembly protein PilB
MKKRLGDILIEEGLINDTQLAIALGDQKQWGGRLGSTLVKKGFVREEDMAYALGNQLGFKWVSLRDLNITQKALDAVKADIAKKYNIMPLGLKGNDLTIAMGDPTDLKTIDTLGFITGKKIKPVIAVESDIILSIAKHYDKEFIATDAYKEVVKAKKKPAPVQGQARGNTIETKKTLESLIKLLIRKNLISVQELKDIIEEGD